jgi:hypothetical protein
MMFGRLTRRMSYRRRESKDAGLTSKISHTESLAAVSSIRFYSVNLNVLLGQWRNVNDMS